MGCFELAEAQLVKCFASALVAALKPFDPPSNITMLGRLFGKVWMDLVSSPTASWT